MNKTRLQQRLEREFNRNLKEYTRDLLTQFTQRTVAAMYEVHRDTLRQWCVEWGISCPKGRKDEFSPPGRLDKKAIALGFDDMADAVRYYKLRKKLSDREIGQRVGCCRETVSHNRPDELKGVMVKYTREGRVLR